MDIADPLGAGGSSASQVLESVLGACQSASRNWALPGALKTFAQILKRSFTFSFEHLGSDEIQLPIL